jgi:hypothetical protein
MHPEKKFPQPGAHARWQSAPEATTGRAISGACAWYEPCSGGALLELVREIGWESGSLSKFPKIVAAKAAGVSLAPDFPVISAEP